MKQRYTGNSRRRDRGDYTQWTEKKALYIKVMHDLFTWLEFENLYSVFYLFLKTLVLATGAFLLFSEAFGFEVGPELMEAREFVELSLPLQRLQLRLVRRRSTR